MKSKAKIVLSNTGVQLSLIAIVVGIILSSIGQPVAGVGLITAGAAFIEGKLQPRPRNDQGEAYNELEGE